MNHMVHAVMEWPESRPFREPTGPLVFKEGPYSKLRAQVRNEIWGQFPTSWLGTSVVELGYDVKAALDPNDLRWVM